MTVWIINPFDNLPAEGFRPQRYWLMAKAFAARGHRVVYWSSDFSHALKRRRTLDCAAISAAAGFEVKLVSTPAYPRNISLWRLWSHRQLARRWLLLARSLVPLASQSNNQTIKQSNNSPDLIIASMPPLGLASAALRFAREVGAKFVLDIQDAWPETFYRLGPRFLFAGMRRTSGRLYREADAISCVARRYQELPRQYGATTPVFLSRHGIELMGELPPARVRREGENLRLVYVGNMGASYDLETVVEAVKSMPDVELDLAGAGPKEEALKGLAEGCARIRFHGYVDAEQMNALLRRADVGLIPMFPDSCVGVPYKLADYAAAGLRVINSLPGETAELIARYGAGVFYLAGHEESFRGAVCAVKNEDAGFDSHGFRSEFDAMRIYAEYLALIEKVFSD